MTYNKIITPINACKTKHGGQNSQWYVGITSDPVRRLFTEHKVKKEGGVWIYCKADSAAIARKVERDYLDIDCSGGSGGGDATSVYVYAYRITTTTNETT